MVIGRQLLLYHAVLYIWLPCLCIGEAQGFALYIVTQRKCLRAAPSLVILTDWLIILHTSLPRLNACWTCRYTLYTLGLCTVSLTCLCKRQRKVGRISYYWPIDNVTRYSEYSVHRNIWVFVGAYLKKLQRG